MLSGSAAMREAIVAYSLQQHRHKTKETRTISNTRKQTQEDTHRQIYTEETHYYASSKHTNTETQIMRNGVGRQFH